MPFSLQLEPVGKVTHSFGKSSLRGCALPPRWAVARPTVLVRIGHLLLEIRRSRPSDFARPPAVHHCPFAAGKPQQTKPPAAERGDLEEAGAEGSLLPYKTLAFSRLIAPVKIHSRRGGVGEESPLPFGRLRAARPRACTSRSRTAAGPRTHHGRYWSPWTPVDLPYLIDFN